MIDLEQIRKRVDVAQYHQREQGTTFEFRCAYGDDEIAADIQALLAEVDHLNYLLRDRDACLAEVKDDLRREEEAGHEIRRKLEAEIVRLRKIEEAAKKVWADMSPQCCPGHTPNSPHWSNCRRAMLEAALSPEPR